MRWLLLLPIALLLTAGVVVSVVRLSTETACPSGGDAPVPVLVARQLIPEGTRGSVIVKRRLYGAAAIRCNERKPGAFADPTSLLDRAGA